MLTHDNHLWNVVNSLSFGRGLREGDVTVTVAPMFHISGLEIHTLPRLYAGGTNVLLPAFDPVPTLDAMLRMPGGTSGAATGDPGVLRPAAWKASPGCGSWAGPIRCCRRGRRQAPWAP